LVLCLMSVGLSWCGVLDYYIIYYIIILYIIILYTYLLYYIIILLYTIIFYTLPNLLLFSSSSSLLLYSSSSHTLLQSSLPFSSPLFFSSLQVFLLIFLLIHLPIPSSLLPLSYHYSSPLLLSLPILQSMIHSILVGIYIRLLIFSTSHSFYTCRYLFIFIYIPFHPSQSSHHSSSLPPHSHSFLFHLISSFLLIHSLLFFCSSLPSPFFFSSIPNIPILLIHSILVGTYARLLISHQDIYLPTPIPKYLTPHVLRGLSV